MYFLKIAIQSHNNNKIDYQYKNNDHFGYKYQK